MYHHGCGGEVFCDEVDASVEGTRCGPIMLMRSSGFSIATGSWEQGVTARLGRFSCWYIVF